MLFFLIVVMFASVLLEEYYIREHFVQERNLAKYER